MSTQEKHQDDLMFINQADNPVSHQASLLAAKLNPLYMDVCLTGLEDSGFS